jgi:hypothetical protein
MLGAISISPALRRVAVRWRDEMGVSTPELVSRREQALADAEARLDERVAELEGHRHAAPPPDSLKPVTAVEHVEQGPWLLGDLRGLLQRVDAVDVARAEQWSSFVALLGNYADAEGRIPSRFDWLIEETFGELAESR